MSVRSYYRWALALPLLVPALASPLMLMDRVPGAVEIALYFLYWSVMIGGVPYLLFGAGFLLWMRRVPESRLRTAVLLSPLVYTAVLIVCFGLFLLVDGTLGNSADSLGMMAALSLPIGYFYVALAELGRALLRPRAAPAVPAPAA